jgi:glycosyltransferase involved in cell wall biosynthesis
MRILVFPRDSNPYQEMLYGEMRRQGAEVAYLGRLTPFGVVNLLLLPLELWVRRLAGGQVVHLHWVWGFSFPGAGKFAIMRHLSQWWLVFCLRAIRGFGFRLCWTAHNVLPHFAVFGDDVVARRILIEQCDLVFVHSSWTVEGLAEIGAPPKRWTIVRHPPFELKQPADRKFVSRERQEVTEFLFFGKIFDYKGVEELLRAFILLPTHRSAKLVIVGQCNDASLRSSIEDLATQSELEVTLRLEHIPDGEIDALMASAQVVVLPFRRVTTSGSAILALSYGKPLVVPDLAALSELPEAAIFRYDGTVPGLTAALTSVIDANDATLARMASAAMAYSSEATWEQMATATMEEISRIIAEKARSTSLSDSCWRFARSHACCRRAIADQPHCTGRGRAIGLP